MEAKRSFAPWPITSQEQVVTLVCRREDRHLMVIYSNKKTIDNVNHRRVIWFHQFEQQCGGKDRVEKSI